ncbi:hypothetical protein FRC12_010485 [Ceratobasidium sp. 428]|nr:hypothetical protein FRC12_010485 [Ceratobasidium sp. 428]
MGAAWGVDVAGGILGDAGGMEDVEDVEDAAKEEQRPQAAGAGFGDSLETTQHHL